MNLICFAAIEQANCLSFVFFACFNNSSVGRGLFMISLGASYRPYCKDIMGPPAALIAITPA